MKAKKLIVLRYLSRLSSRGRSFWERQLLSLGELTPCFSSCSWFQGDFPQQRPLRRLQVQTAQKRSDGQSDWNESVLLQGHSESPPSQHKQTVCVAKEQWIRKLPETSVPEEGWTFLLRTVNAVIKTSF